MSVLTPPLIIALLLVTSAVAGPALLRAGAPLLMRVPRAAVAVLLTSLGTWLLAAASLSLLLAWTLTGPDLLPGAVGEVCQRCLDASTPFTPDQTVETALPIAVLVALPVLGAAAVLVLGARRAVRARSAARDAARDITAGARAVRLAGHDVWLVPDEEPAAFALPAGLGGIVVSAGLRRALSDAELRAVLAHEGAHLRQRHHLVLSATRSLAEPLRWIPLAAAIADAVPRYLEIAADESARRCSGTRSLASALLKIGAPVRPATSAAAAPATAAAPAGPLLHAGLLHAGGPDRIRHLVAPAGTGSALLPTALLSGLMLALTAVIVAVHGPYLQVLLAGCAITG
ncbi:M56 family metallopeptidase [Brachybacterium fresconis]|uniref:Zn-dependent protease with chaperone function n=1 Tax=Brachybacterium fresconis TaxID=173363 RepID=A0ABS4YKW6_9MICO|nr:M56 family metallopeptidase [Brachybacterium fresconis]MBP2409443.1 Zn-dependent protease with chaperone function [Brachybacterium fresconis]